MIVVVAHNDGGGGGEGICWRVLEWILGINIVMRFLLWLSPDYSSFYAWVSWDMQRDSCIATSYDVYMFR